MTSLFTEPLDQSRAKLLSGYFQLKRTLRWVESHKAYFYQLPVLFCCFWRKNNTHSIWDVVLSTGRNLASSTFKYIVLNLRISGRLFVIIQNNIGSKIEARGTPLLTLSDMDFSLSHPPICFLCLRSSALTPNKQPPMLMLPFSKGDHYVEPQRFCKVRVKNYWIRLNHCICSFQHLFMYW